MREVGWRRRRFYRRTWLRMLPGAALMLSSLAVVLVIPSAFVRGVVVGAACTTVLAAVLSVAREADGGQWLREGAEAERWTATDLRWFAWWRRLYGQRWHVVHSIGFARGDVDHVLIGPGGVYAVDTKYRSDTGRQHDRRADVDLAQQQLATATRRIAALIRQHTGHDIEVGAILMTQGRGWPWHRDASWRRVEDTLVLHGNRMHRWHAALPHSGLPPSTCRTIAHALTDWSAQQLHATAGRT